jgi:hypothetical protein
MIQHIITLDSLKWSINDKIFNLHSLECEKLDDYYIHVFFIENENITIRIFDRRETIVNGIIETNIESFITSLGLISNI